MTNFLDLYSDYLICSSGRTTATGLSAVTDGQVSHDQITRLLDGAELNGKILWTKIKKLVRRYESDDACLIFDDTIVPKPSMDENDIACLPAGRFKDYFFTVATTSFKVQKLSLATISLCVLLKEATFYAKLIGEIVTKKTRSTSAF